MEYNYLDLNHPDEVIEDMAANSWNVDLLHKIAQKYSKTNYNHYIILTYLSRNPYVSSETLDILSDCDSFTVRCEVAMNKKTSAKTLDDMSRRKYNFNIGGISKNPNTPFDTLKYMAGFELNYTYNNFNQKICLFENDKTNAEILSILSKDKDCRILMSVAKHNKTPKNLSNKLLLYLFANSIFRKP